MIEIVHQLRMARGNGKQRVLEQFKHNDEWLRVLRAMYDSSINYYIGPPKEQSFVDDIDIDAMLDDLDLLASRTYVGNQARLFAYECSERYGEIFRLILGGSLKAGVSTTTINKIYPGLIPTFKVMLAKDVPVSKYPVLASTKYDGVRLVAFVKDGKCILKTRQGKQVFISSLNRQMSRLRDGIFDGELVSGDGKQAGRTAITGQVNKCLKGTADDIVGYTFCIFDFVPLRDWEMKNCQMQYAERLEILQDFVSGPNILVADQKLIENKKDIEELYQDRLANGYEGLILRYPFDRYEWKRSNKLIKRKATNEIVLTCVGVEEGKGKYEGMIGALLLEGEKGLKRIKVKAGSGLSDYDRGLHSNHYIGKEIEVLYNDVVRAENADHWSLFLPRYKRIHKDFDV